MNRFLDAETDPKQLSPLDLAFLGDCVYELFVRERLVTEANRPAGDLHAAKVRWVNADAQAEALQRIAPLLTEEEEAVFRRGRNTHTNHTPKNKSVAAYHAATGFEALFGYLYLKGELDRLRTFFDIIYNGQEEDSSI